MNKIQKKPGVFHEGATLRVGEGIPVEVTPHTSIGVNGITKTTFQVNLANAPVPDRRYVCDIAAVEYKSSTVKLLFAQEKVYGSDLRSLLVIHMSPLAARHFLQSFENGGTSVLDGVALSLGVELEELGKFTVEPDQTVAFAANMAMCVTHDLEATLDFYKASSFSLVNATTARKIGIDPVVRVDLRTTLLISIVNELKELSSRFPPSVMEAKNARF